MRFLDLENFVKVEKFQIFCIVELMRCCDLWKLVELMIFFCSSYSVFFLYVLYFVYIIILGDVVGVGIYVKFEFFDDGWQMLNLGWG